jgi:alkaline phosphatase D
MRQTCAMEPISRRLFLAGSAAVVVAACSGDDEASTTASAPATTDATDPTDGTDAPESTVDASTSEPAASTVPATGGPAVLLPDDPFTLGVASGDPGERSVVLWTRLAPAPLTTGGGMPADDVEVRWEIALDPEFAEIRWTGSVTATAAYGHSVHVRADIDTGTEGYHYRFHAGGHTSPAGITRTTPATTAEPESVRFASASCQHYESGYYVAHRDIASQAPDFLVWLGDYIYEGGSGSIGDENGNVRTHGTPEIVTLDDYRNRYALYKSDPDLQAAHAACPWLVTWDDHEVENNYAGLVPQDPNEAATFAQRRNDAYQAWWEHQPVDLPPPVLGEDYPIYRAFSWGALLTLTLLDGRQYRSDQVCGDGTLNLDPACPETFDETRTMIGDAQEEWLFGELNGSTTTWNVIAQQTVFGDTTLGEAVLNYDQWDGYPVQRNRIVDRLASDGVGNVIVLTGDIHFAGTGTIRSGGRGVGTPVGTEFVATSISSGGRIDPGVTAVVKSIPDIIDVELEHRGYILHTVTPPAWTAQYRMVDSVKEPDSVMYQHAIYGVDAGTDLVRVLEGIKRD